MTSQPARSSERAAARTGLTRLVALCMHARRASLDSSEERWASTATRRVEPDPWIRPTSKRSDHERAAFEDR